MRLQKIFYFLLSTEYYRQRSRRADSGKASYPQLASVSFLKILLADFRQVRFKLGGVASVFQNLTKFFINF